MTYVVTGAYVMVKTGTSDGPMFVGLLKDRLVPDDVDQAHIEHLLSVGLISEVDGPALLEEPVVPVKARSSR